MNQEITWKEALIGAKGLKDLRAENNLEIPEYYRKSTWRLAVSLSVCSLIFGSLVGGILVYIYMVI